MLSSVFADCSKNLHKFFVIPETHLLSSVGSSSGCGVQTAATRWHRASRRPPFSQKAPGTTSTARSNYTHTHKLKVFK